METKEKIIETAFKIFLDKGFSNCSMSDLVNETKLSKGAFYHHFKSKEDLYKSVIDTYFISYYEQIDWNENKKMNVQEIELMINPISSVSIAKKIIEKLNESGPLSNLLEKYWYEKGKLKTASIVSFGLKPLIKIDE